MNKPTRTPLSTDQLADAKRLSDIYKARAKESRLRGDGPALTLTEVGEQCGWNSPQSTVSQYMNGKVALNLDALIKLSRVLKFEPSEVSPALAGGVTLLPGTSYGSHSFERKDEVNETAATYGIASSSTPLPVDHELDDDQYAFIPQFTARAAAGAGHENAHVEIRNTLAFKKAWIKGKGLQADNLMVIHAAGSSMWPTISDRDVLLVDISRIEPADGEVFVIESQVDGTLVKRISATPMGGWVLRSDNQDKDAHPDRYYLRSESNEHKIVGRVVWRGGDL